MYESLAKNHSHFHLYVFPFDDIALKYLQEANLPSVTLISLKEFEDPELLAVKPNRTKGEYCWTCTPSVILYCLKKFNIQSCTYVDADLYFFSDTQTIFSEMLTNSILLTEHRYSSWVKFQNGAGIYCVQFMSFKNNLEGLTALTWWRNKCIEWCFARFEDGKFGDQGYLDDWTSRFPGVHVMQTYAAGIAPWNIDQYSTKQIDGKIAAWHNGENIGSVIFYHFHALKINTDGSVTLGDYKYSNDAINNIYAPYIKRLYQLDQQLQAAGIPLSHSVRPKQTIRQRFGAFRRKVMGRNNIYKLGDLIK